MHRDGHIVLSEAPLDLTDRARNLIAPCTRQQSGTLTAGGTQRPLLDYIGPDGIRFREVLRPIDLKGKNRWIIALERDGKLVEESIPN